MQDMLIIGDLHFPFQHPNLNNIIAKAIKDYQPKKIFITGDLLDAYFASLFNKSPNSKGATDELKAALKSLKSFYSTIGSIPVECAIGNHDLRILKRIIESNIPTQFIREFRDVIQAPTTWKFAESFKTDKDVYKFHGEGFSGMNAGITMLKHFNCNVIAGHLHSLFGVVYNNNGISTHWCIMSGCLIDVKAYAFEYGKNVKDKPICGFIVIKNNIPIPVLL